MAIPFPGTGLAAACRVGTNVHLDFAGPDGVRWGYIARVVWVNGPKAALTLPEDGQVRASLAPGTRLDVTTMGPDSVATCTLHAQGISLDPPPLLIAALAVRHGGRPRLAAATMFPAPEPKSGICEG